MGFARVSFLLSLLLFGSAIGLIAYAITHGGATAGVFLVFPFVAGSSAPLAAGVLLLVLGFFVLFFALASIGGGAISEGRPSEGARASSSQPAAGGAPTLERRVSYGGFLLIGPVPVVFGNRPGWLLYLIAMAVVTLLAVLVFLLLVVL